jgi:hypothetical protein
MLQKNAKRSYDRNRKFQLEWQAKLPWAETIVSLDGSLYQVRYCTCSVVDGRDRIMAAKWDTLLKHEGHRKAKRDISGIGIKKGDKYIVKSCRHQAALAVYNTRQPLTVLQQVNSFSSLERRKKKVQFASIFHFLFASRPMVHYESLEGLYSFLEVPNLPRMHWSDNSA